VNPVNVGSIGEYIRQQREQAKISMRQLASAAGVSNPYLSQIERGLRRPSAEILQQIAKGLRISAEALYVQAGILEDRRPDSGVRAAVLADPELTERQKQVLLEIYESFRRELAPGLAVDAGADSQERDGTEPASLLDQFTGQAGELAGPEAATAAGQDAIATVAAGAGAAQAGAAQAGAAQAGPVQADPAQAGPVQADPAQAGPAQAGPVQADPAQAGPVQAGPVQAGPADADPLQNGARG
jgi:transcriptional regulator with XRE-family HTH domain